MQKRETAPRSPHSAGEFAFAVPFAWEAKPGVAKETHEEINLQAPSYNQTDAPSSLRKPPCLQDALCKQPSFSFAQYQGRHGKLLVRKQSLNSLLPFTSNPTPLARNYSHGNLQLQRQQHHHTALIKLEDDPFFMAIQACKKGHSFKKEPIKLYFHQGNVKYRKDATPPPPPPPPTQPQRSHNSAADFKHLTIRQLCKLEEEKLKRVQSKPLMVSDTFQRKHKMVPFGIISRCLGKPLMVSDTFQRKHKMVPFGIISRCLGS